jgi:hypothetical protein
MPDDPHDELGALLVPTGELVRPSVDWAQVEAEVSMRLPGDYKRFVDRYGAGSVEEFPHIFHPTVGIVLAGTAAAELDGLHEYRSYDHREPGDVPFPVWPEPGGLYPFARTMDGDCCYWRTADADPDRWTVVLSESFYDWWEHPTGMAAFLADVLTGRARYPIFLDEWPKPSHDWEPVPTAW